MPRRVLAIQRAALSTGAAATMAFLSFLPAAAGAQEAPTNLKVLSKETTRQEINRVMRGFTTALGVRCSDCHVGEEGQPLSTYDFASDAKPMKERARIMLRMTMDINGTHLADLPERREPNVGVTCVTCHRGVARPEAIEALVRRTLDGEGVDAALVRYRELRERYFGGFAYDFTDRPLIAVAEGLTEGNAEGARRVLEANLEFNPRSAPTLFALARLHDTAGGKDKAIEYYRRGLEIMPDNAQAQRRLRELTGGE